MPLSLVYAKKIRLPAKSAHILQSLNMALAFGRAGAVVHCYPGCSRDIGRGMESAELSPKAVLENTLQMLGAGAVPANWSILPGGNKGLYGLLFRLAMASHALSKQKAVFFARDMGEQRFLSHFSRFKPLFMIYEAHEILHLMQQSEGKPHWRSTMAEEKRVFSSISGLVAVNGTVAEQARQCFGYNGPVLLAPNGFNPDFFHSLPLFSTETPWPESGATVTLAYVGAFHPGKGLPVLLQALHHLPARFRLRVIGGVPVDRFEELKTQARQMQLVDRVDFLGGMPPQQIRSACAGAHIFVIPQDSDYFFSPLKLYEAMAMGLPVVTSSLKLFQTYRDAGLVHSIPGRGPESLAMGIREVAENPLFAQELRERGLKEAEQRSWLRRAENVLRFIADLRRES